MCVQVYTHTQIYICFHITCKLNAYEFLKPVPSLKNVDLFIKCGKIMSICINF